MTAVADCDITGPTQGADRFEGVEHWTARPQLARALRVFTYALPLVLALIAGWLCGRQAITHSWPALARAFSMGLVATVVLVVVERVARRVLPLAALLNLSLVFPDQAPSRFGVALRAGGVGQLESRVAGRNRATEPDSADAAAEILTQVFALHRHDRRTRGHSERVRAFAVMIGEALELAPEELDRLQWASLLHDIGKLEVPAEILNKDGRPTDEEWSTLATHPANGERLIAPLAPWLGEWVGAVTEHHERWDGEGYPRGLRAGEISLAGRIVAVADAFEVMTAARSYKRPLSISAARTELTRCAGKQFDPQIVRVFLNVSIGRIRRGLSPLAWLGQLPFVPAATAAIPAPGILAASGALVGSLVLGPAITPLVDGASAAEPTTTSAQATADPVVASAHQGSAGEESVTVPMPSPAPRSEADEPAGSSTSPSGGTGPSTPDPTRYPATPPTPTDREAPLAPVVDDLLSPVVDPLSPVTDPLVTPLVDATGALAGTVTPLVDRLTSPLLP